jgi:signal transduction histidine kinase
VDNLVENACKYSEPGTEIVVRAWREDGSVVLGDEDHGCGVGAEDLARVFDPFFRGEPVRRAGHAGVGLGLAVAQRIARTFGGMLEVRSEPEAGCFFLLRLPAAHSCEVQAVAAATCGAHAG